MMTKTCSSCGEPKPFSEFHRDTSRKDGYSYRCKTCERSRKMQHNAKSEVKTTLHKRYEELKQSDSFVERKRERGRIYSRSPAGRTAAAKSRVKPSSKEKMKAHQARYASDPVQIAAARDRSRRRYLLNPAYFIEKGRARTAHVANRTPVWAQRDKIKALYLEARTLRDAGIDCVVDHVIPLKGKLVCGLHCEFNLQIISRIDNAKKHAKFNI